MRFTEPPLDLWSSIKPNCCWSQQLLPVTSYLNNEKRAASGLLEKGNWQAGRFPTESQRTQWGSPLVNSTPPRRGLKGAGSAQHPAVPLTNLEMCQASGSQGLLGCNWTLWDAGEGKTTGEGVPAHRHFHFHLTATSLPSSTHCVPCTAATTTRQKGSDWFLLLWRNRSCFPKYFKNSIQQFVTWRLYVVIEGRKSRPGNVAA